MEFYDWDYEILWTIVEFNNELSLIIIMIGNMDFYMNHKWIIYNYDWGISIEYPHIGKPMNIISMNHIHIGDLIDMKT
jgi:protein tyrosine phosphatase